MSEEYFTVQHPPFFVSDQRAINVICGEIGIKSIDEICRTGNAHTIEQQAIAAYVLRLYTGLSLVQTAKVLSVGYGALNHRLYDLEKKIKENKYSAAAKSLNNIINKL